MQNSRHGGAKRHKLEVINYSNFSFTLHTIQKCAGDFTEYENDHHKSTF